MITIFTGSFLEKPDPNLFSYDRSFLNMKKKTLIIAVLLTAAIFFAGCTSPGIPDTGQTTKVTQTKTSAATPEPTYSVTEPVLVIAGDIYSTKITIEAEEKGGNTLTVAIRYDSSTLPSTGAGSQLMATIFAYNYDDVPYDFNPKTKEDVINSGIPYKTVQSTVYPNNKVTAGADLPGDSVQGSLNLAKPYNYGAIIDKIGTR